MVGFDGAFGWKEYISPQYPGSTSSVRFPQINDLVVDDVDVEQQLTAHELAASTMIKLECRVHDLLLDYYKMVQMNEEFVLAVRWYDYG